MLAVLHEVGQNMRHGIIQKQDFKVVYVAPMKALAAEVTAAFSRRLGPLGAYPQEISVYFTLGLSLINAEKRSLLFSGLLGVCCASHASVSCALSTWHASQAGV